MSVLERILQAKRTDLAREMEAVSLRRVIEMATQAPPPRDFAGAVGRAGRVNIIAEIKRASPSRGRIRADADVGATARAYADAGAAALSVLTDTRFFLGAPEHLTEAKEAVAPPVLRKDFIIDEYQVYQSRAIGADAILLIARILAPRELATLIGVARSMEMQALVEAHAEEEIDAALLAGANLIGINNRDLASLHVSIDNSLRLAGRLPDGVLKVSESGIETAGDIRRLRDAGYHAFLVGERLMRDADPGAALRALLSEDAA